MTEDWREQYTPEQYYERERRRLARKKPQRKRGRPRKQRFTPERRKQLSIQFSIIAKRRHKEDPNLRKVLIEKSRAVTKEKSRLRAPLRKQRDELKAEGLDAAVRAELVQEQRRLYQTAKELLEGTGLEPETHQPLEYYERLIELFNSKTV